MRSAILCSRAEYFTDQHHSSRQVPLGEWFVSFTIAIVSKKQIDQFRDGEAREIAIIKYAEYAELDIAAIRQLYPRRDIHHFTPENKRIVR